jgi:energy-coupling factor transporter ATP-binding protein EcfA2
VLQEPASQLLQATVSDELAFTARNLGLPEPEVRERVEEWARRLGLGGELGRDPRALSAGCQQLVLLGAALATRPRLLVVDEGGAHWDPVSRGRALEAVRIETARGMTVIWVTQEPEERRAAARTLVLEGPSPSLEPRPPAGASAERATSPALRLDVAAWDGTETRAIRSFEPIRVDCGPGRPTAVRGPNGSGKTVLLEAAVGLRAASQVSVHWLEPHPAAPIMAGQHAELEVFAETVVEEMTFAARARGVARDRAIERAVRALHAVGYGNKTLSRRVWELSAGERRLVQVLAVTVAPAGLIALDEPTCGLDPERRAGLAAWIRVRARETPVLVASQDPEWLAWVGAENVFLGAYLT